MFRISNNHNRIQDRIFGTGEEGGGTMTLCRDTCAAKKIYSGLSPSLIGANIAAQVSFTKLKKVKHVKSPTQVSRRKSRGTGEEGVMFNLSTLNILKKT